MRSDANPLPRVGGFRLSRVIGCVAVGVVWLAGEGVGRPCALKVVERHAAIGSGFDREQSTLRHVSSLDLSNVAIVPIGHVGVEADFLFYSMPLADQTDEGSPVTLARWIESGGPQSPSELLDLVERLVVGLRALHDAVLVHRDIKPSNVLRIGGEWMLGDIGLVAPERTEMTAVETADFQPPRGAIDRRADTYVMGRLLYCAFTGLSARSFPTLPAELLMPEL